MSHFNRRTRGDIWKKTSKNVAPSSTTPPIRPSNSFMEKLLRDCLKPSRKYKPITDDTIEYTNTISLSGKGSRTKHYQQPRESILPITVSSASNTPPRSNKDSRHYQPGDYRRNTDSAKNAPPLGNTSLQPRDYGLIADGSRTTPPRSAYLQPRDYGRFADGARTTPLRSKYYQPRNYGLISTDAKTITPRKIYQPRYYGPITNDNTQNAINAHTSENFYEPQNHRFVIDDTAKTIPPRRDRDSRHQSQSRNSSLSQPSATVSPLFFSQEEREQALRDYKVTIEYKHLKSHAPGGVYLIPSMDSLRNFHGIIFVRRGPFTNGIFKFRLDLPAKYNDTNMWPRITFLSKVFNPYVNEKTGQLDVQSAYPTWDPSRHYLVTVLTYLKKIFYSKNFTDAKANPSARELAEKDPQSYKKKVEACVHQSQKKVYVNEKGSTAKFTEEEVAHRVLRDLLKHHIRNDNQVTKHTILAQVDKARKV